MWWLVRVEKTSGDSYNSLAGLREDLLTGLSMLPEHRTFRSKEALEALAFLYRRRRMTAPRAAKPRRLAKPGSGTAAKASISA